MKRKAIIISSILIIILSITIITFLVIKKNNKEKLENENNRKEQIIKDIENKYSPFSNNEYITIEEPDNLTTFFNNTLDTHKKIEELTNKDLEIKDLSNIDETIKNLNNLKTETNNIKYEDINLYLNEYEDFAKEKILEIYNKNPIIINIDNDYQKIQEYVKNIDNNLSKLDFFKNNKNKYTIKNNIIIYKEDNFYNDYKKLNLNLPIQKYVDPGKPIPILMYHGINDNVFGNSSLFVTVQDFDNQMKYLHDNGFTTLFLSEINQAQNFEKPIIITFDDGYIDNYTNAFPILKKYNIKASMYVITQWLDGTNCLSPQMILEMHNSGLVEIGSHTLTHVYLGATDYAEQERQLRDSKKYLEELLGKEINTIAYPYGSANNDTYNIARKYYSYAVTTSSGYNYAKTLGYIYLKRFKIPRGYSFESFKYIVNATAA